MTVIAHDYSTAPFGAHDISEEPMLNHVDDHARTRLVNLGFTDDQAAAFVAERGASVVRSASDKALAKHLEVAQAADSGFDPAKHSIEEVLAYVGDHPAKAAAVLAAEQAGKGRKTLVPQLEELSAPADDGLGNTPDSGAEPDDADPSD